MAAGKGSAPATQRPTSVPPCPLADCLRTQRPAAPQTQLDARLTDCLRTHVLGWHSFAYSADPRRSSLQDAATEVRESCLRDCAAVCRSWRGFVAPVPLEERRRFVDETHLLRTPACTRSSTASIRRPTCSRRPPSRGFAEAFFRDGDALVIDCEALQKAT